MLTTTMTYLKKSIFVFAVFAAAFPVFADAASTRPMCELTVTTSKNIIHTTKEAQVVVSEGESVKMAWESNNAKTAHDGEGDSIDLNGSATYRPEESTTYSYRFRSSSRSVTCSVEVVVATVTIDEDSLRTDDETPSLEGTASGVRAVRVVLESNDKTVWKSKDIKIRRGAWRTTSKKRLADGAYDVFVYGTKDLKSHLFASSTLVIGDETEAPMSGSGSIVVSPIPLLFGGTARVGMSVPVAYVKVQNTGTTEVAISGFNVRQKGTAPVGTVIGFSTADDKGGSRFVVGGIEGTTPFVGQTAFVPLAARLAPGQFRIFTLKAIMGAKTAASVGTQLMIDVDSVKANAKIAGLLPMRGTTWTLTY